MPQHIVICDLGRVEYEPAWELQKRIQARLIEAKRSDPPEAIPHVMLLVEHPPVYTLGKSGDAGNLLASEELLQKRGATFHHIDRGGDITYHGPGQIVGYPILDLDRFFTDIHRYLRELEGAVIDTCTGYGVLGRRIEGRTGVWIGPDERGFERKICAMGIRCSRWVTMHGFAFNVDTELDYFDLIVPCGISDRTATSLVNELGRNVETHEVKERLVERIAERFAATTAWLESDTAREYLEAYLAAERVEDPHNEVRRNNGVPPLYRKSALGSS